MEIKQEICENFAANLNSPLSPKIIQDCHSKCGEVYLSNNGHFLFHCDICNKKYENFKYFLHISTDHTEMLDNKTNFSAASSNSINTSHFEINCTPIPTLDVVELELNNTNTQLNCDLAAVYPTKRVHCNQASNRQYNCNTNKIIKPYDWEYDTQIETIINFIRNTPKYLITGNNFTRNKERIFQPLSEQLNISIEQILKKFKYLKSKLSLEKRILLEKRSKKDFKYEPTWGWYESFKFWDDDIATIKSNLSSVTLKSSVADDSALNNEITKRKAKLFTINNVNDIKKSKIIKDNSKINRIKITKQSIDECPAENKDLYEYDANILNFETDINAKLQFSKDNWREKSIKDIIFCNSIN